MANFLSGLLTAYTFILIARIVLEWYRAFAVQRGGSSGTVLVRAYGILHDLTEPVLRPIRRLIPPLRVGVAAIDLSPIIVFVLISLLQRVVVPNLF